MYATMVTFKTFNRWSAKNIIEGFCEDYGCNFTTQFYGEDCDLKWTVYGEQAPLVVKHASRYYWFLGEE